MNKFVVDHASRRLIVKLSYVVALNLFNQFTKLWRGCHKKCRCGHKGSLLNFCGSRKKVRILREKWKYGQANDPTYHSHSTCHGE